MQNATNKKADPVELFLIGFFKVIAGFFKAIFYGIKKLNSVKSMIGLLFFILVAAGAYMQRDYLFKIDAPIYIQWLILCVLIGLPLLYLFALGSKQVILIKKYNSIFEDFNFIGKNKKYPQLVYKRQNDKKTILAFRSNIPLDTWFKSKMDLETNLDCNVTKIEQRGSKKEVELTTISSEYKIPTEISWNDKLIIKEDGVLVAGENALRKILVKLNKSPHVLIAGETGGGKSVLLRLFLWQFIHKGGVPFMFDFKGGVEFGIDYENYGEVVTEREAALELLDLLVQENAIRLKKFRAVRAKNLKQYNDKTGENLTRLGVFCDEIGEMLDKQGATGEDKEFIQQINGKLSTLARLARSTGINLFMGTQRPDANVLTGQIKNNLTNRFCARLGDKPASEIVIGNTAAYYLPDIKGRFLFRSGADTEEFQAYYFDDDTMLGEVENAEYHVLLPELAKRLVSSPAAPATSSPPMKTQEAVKNKPVKKGEKVVELDFDFKKAVNK